MVSCELWQHLIVYNGRRYSIWEAEGERDRAPKSSLETLRQKGHLKNLLTRRENGEDFRKVRSLHG